MAVVKNIVSEYSYPTYIRTEEQKQKRGRFRMAVQYAIQENVGGIWRYSLDENSPATIFRMKITVTDIPGNVVVHEQTTTAPAASTEE